MKIALIGKSRSGKDTVAEYLEKKYRLHNYKFSYGITEIIKKYFPKDLEKGIKLRGHYIKIGQSLRELDEDVWVNYTLNKINYLWGSLENVVISDVRQENEFKRLAGRGFRFIYIECDDDIRNERIKENGEELPSNFDNDPDKNIDYIFERYMGLIDVVSNNQSLEKLFHEVDKKVADYKSKNDNKYQNLVKLWLTGLDDDYYLKSFKDEIINKIKDIIGDKLSNVFLGIGLTHDYKHRLYVDIYIKDSYINRMSYLPTMLKNYKPKLLGTDVVYILRRGGMIDGTSNR